MHNIALLIPSHLFITFSLILFKRYPQPINTRGWILEGFCDAAFGANNKTKEQRSNYGWIFTLGGAPISWCAKKHKCVSLHTIDAEFLTIKEATTQALHLRFLLEELEAPQSAPTTLRIDNSATYDLAYNDVFSKRMKHVIISIEFVREQVIKQSITLTLVPTTDQAADFLTKPLPRAAHEKCCSLLGMHLKRTSEAT